MSPHLAQLGVPSSFDDGVAIGEARLDGHTVLSPRRRASSWAAVLVKYGAKLVGLFKRALRDRPCGGAAGGIRRRAPA
jgi:malonate decarboxylase beta subunit